MDALVRLHVAARRLGGCIRLRDVCDELEELLELVGLLREMSGKAEGGEEGTVVEEGVELGDSIP